MDLRPHHALCIQKYTGHGYDERFTEHMTGLVDILRASPDTEIRLVSGCDDLCAACPNCTGGKCSTLEKVEAMDAALLSACGLGTGVTVPWSRLRDAAKAAVFDTDEFQKICSACQWYPLCASITQGLIDVQAEQ